MAIIVRSWAVACDSMSYILQKTKVLPWSVEIKAGVIKVIYLLLKCRGHSLPAKVTQILLISSS